MSKVVYYGFPLYAHMIQTFPLIEELVLRGEDVTCCANDIFKMQIELTGATFHSYLNEYSEDPSEVAWNYSLFMQRAHDVIRKEVERLKTIKVDYIIYDRSALWGPILSKMFGLPSICTHTSIVGSFQALRLQPIWDLIIYYFKRLDMISLIPKYLSAMRTVRVIKREFNFNEVIVPEANANLLLVNLVKQFQPFHDVHRENVKFIGWLPSNKYRNKGKDFPWDQIKEGKIIYISLGTTYNRDSDFYIKCFESFKDTDYQIVISTGQGKHLDLPSGVPHNFILAEWVPQLEILKRADVFVTQGGTSSVCESLYHDCPVVVVPQMAEQHTLGYWIERIKVGKHIKGGFVSSTNLRKAVETVLSNPLYRQNSIKMGEAFRNAGGVNYAVDEIFKLKKEFGLM